MREKFDIRKTAKTNIRLDQDISDDEY